MELLRYADGHLTNWILKISFPEKRLSGAGVALGSWQLRLVCERERTAENQRF